MDIRAFKIRNSEELTLGEKEESITRKLKAIGQDVEIHIGRKLMTAIENGYYLMYLDLSSTVIVFDSDWKMVGFYNNEADGKCEETLDISLVDVDGEVHNLTLSDYIGELCNKEKDLSEYDCTEIVTRAKNKLNIHPKLYYNTELNVNGDICVLQCTETFNIYETVSMIKSEDAKVAGGIFKLPKNKMKLENITESIL